VAFLLVEGNAEVTEDAYNSLGLRSPDNCLPLHLLDSNTFKNGLNMDDQIKLKL
jgi:hypothetical protein